jgi:hypothetical protein
MEHGNKSKNKRCKANGWLPELLSGGISTLLTKPRKGLEDVWWRV